MRRTQHPPSLPVSPRPTQLVTTGHSPRRDMSAVYTCPSPAGGGGRVACATVRVTCSGQPTRSCSGKRGCGKTVHVRSGMKPAVSDRFERSVVADAAWVRVSMRTAMPECGGTMVKDMTGTRHREPENSQERNILGCVTWKQAGKGGRGCRESIPAGSLSRARFPFQPPFPSPRHPPIAGFGCASQASVLFGFGGGASGACITHPSNAEPIRPTPMPDAGGGLHDTESGIEKTAF